MKYNEADILKTRNQFISLSELRLCLLQLVKDIALKCKFMTFPKLIWS